MFQRLVHTDNDTASLVLRWTLAIVMFPHGAQKMLGWFGGYGFSATMDAMTGMGLPIVVVFLVILGEFLGPIALAIGFLSRAAAAGLGIIMTGAIFVGHLQHGFFMNWYGNQEGEGFEYHLLFLGIALAIILKGGGRLSMDQKLSQ